MSEGMAIAGVTDWARDCRLFLARAACASGASFSHTRLV